MPRTPSPDRIDFDDDATIVATDGPTSADMPGETVILNPATGRYYGLDGVGTRVWELVQEPRTFSAIRAILEDEYDAAPERLELDLRDLLADLASAGLVTVGDAEGR